MIPGLVGALCGSVIGIALAMWAEDHGASERIQDTIMFLCVFIGMAITL